MRMAGSWRTVLRGKGERLREMGWRRRVREESVAVCKHFKEGERLSQGCRGERHQQELH